MTGRTIDDESVGATAARSATALPRLLRSIAHRLADDVAYLPVEGPLPSFDGATGWLNSQPLTVERLRGRVVLVQFWTYTCINWLRTLPYMRAWDAKYREKGLTVVGVHTPEFGFEKSVENVVTAARDEDVPYPIALDSDYHVWRAFANHFWPALYVADTEGRVRFRHFGEGEYAMTEMAIQRLLLEAGAVDIDQDLVAVHPRGFEIPADWQTLRSPEAYLGYGRASQFGSSERARLDEPHSYPAPSLLALNTWAPSGTWTIAEHAAVLNQPNGRIAFRFQARDVHLVMGPTTRGKSVPFRVLIDGVAPRADQGVDVDRQGDGTLVEQRLYQLVRQASPVRQRLVEIEFLDAGVEAYCFTFG